MLSVIVGIAPELSVIAGGVQETLAKLSEAEVFASMSDGQPVIWGISSSVWKNTRLFLIFNFSIFNQKNKIIEIKMVRQLYKVKGVFENNDNLKKRIVPINYHTMPWAKVEKTILLLQQDFIAGTSIYERSHLLQGKWNAILYLCNMPQQECSGIAIRACLSN